MLTKRFLMLTTRRISSVMISLAMAAAVCSAQTVTSAHSGTLHYFEGDVSIDGTPVQAKVGRFSEIKEQGVLRTAQGRAEVLLTPGVFLRIGENSAIKLLDNRLVSTRVDILEGTVIVESDDPQMTIKDSPVTIVYKDYQIQMAKHGVIEISTDPAVMKVYKGEALVNTADMRASVKEGHELPFSAALLTEKFNDKAGDDLYLWTRDRSQSLSAASMSSARSLNSSLSGSGYGYAGTSGGLYGSGLGAWNGGWYFNPYLDMYTYVPMGGTYFNSFGYGFFSPGTVYNYYAPTTYWYGGGGARGTGSIGRPLNGVTTATTNRPAPLSSLRGTNGTTNGGMPALGSPVRGGSVIGATAPAPMNGGNAVSASAIGGSSTSGSSSIGASRGSGGGGGGGMSTSGGASSGGGMHAASGGHGR
jgi:hypothetical protein